MKNKEKKIIKHNFHFVLTIELKEFIINFASVNNMSLSKTIIYIYNYMKPVLEKHYLRDMNCKIGKYCKFDADTDMHVYFEKKDYKYLKQIQAGLNIFSVGLILRWMIEEFFKGLSQYGAARFFRIIYKYKNIFIRNNKIWKINPEGKHMFSCLDQNKYVKMTYNKEYTLLSIEFL